MNYEITGEFSPEKTESIKYRKSVSSIVLRVLVYTCAGITAAVVFFIIGYILVMGIPNLSWDLFSIKYTSENVSMLPAIINTFLMTLLSLAIAAPIGIFSAIFLAEYAHKGSKVISLIRIASETLASIPSIVYGLFGMLFFVVALGWGYSLLAGALTMSIMILPLVMRTTEEALLSVPDTFREGSFGLGAGKLRTVFTIVLPSAMPGILSGIILAVGRVVGETAALIFTAGTFAMIPKGLFDSTRTLAVHMYVLSSEGLHIDKTYATAVVLLIITILINALSGLIAKKISGKGMDKEI